ncbi:hypothetical protein [Pseudooceanicola sp.]|uniref:hypothetical protein n=1 Tax=Pseudooceanicola sp. TaxID=1914328 RepID=UPI0026051C15|nr:hypothetical protein [Pseudooceanicola sp.]MDF1854886.1 hypothetical protein [Pseudooceanicola sp.]
MVDVPRQVFLDHRTYRRRRLADLARVLPVIGMVLLLMVPLFWVQGAGGTVTSHAILWLFGVWAGLVVLAAWLASRRLEPEVDPKSGPRPLLSDERGRG